MIKFEGAKASLVPYLLLPSSEDSASDVADFEKRLTLDEQEHVYYPRYYKNMDTFPTVIPHDAVGLFRADQITEKYYDPTMQVFVRGLNLYMVSQNGKVSNSKNPAGEIAQQI
ncbi:hypothetical protein MY10362_007902 [Beauveria mimosiformis]